MRQTAVRNRKIDARQILHDNPAGAQIHVTDFGVAHLAVGQADRQAGRCQQGMGLLGHQPIPCGGVGQSNGIIDRLGTVSPAVEYAKNDGALRCVACVSHDLFLIRQPALLRKMAVIDLISSNGSGFGRSDRRFSAMLS